MELDCRKQGFLTRVKLLHFIPRARTLIRLHLVPETLSQHKMLIKACGPRARMNFAIADWLHWGINHRSTIWIQTAPPGWTLAKHTMCSKSFEVHPCTLEQWWHTPAQNLFLPWFCLQIGDFPWRCKVQELETREDLLLSLWHENINPCFVSIGQAGRQHKKHCAAGDVTVCQIETCIVSCPVYTRSLNL